MEGLAAGRVSPSRLCSGVVCRGSGARAQGRSCNPHPASPDWEALGSSLGSLPGQALYRVSSVLLHKVFRRL